MEVDELTLRLLRRYWLVLLLAVAVPVVAMGAYVTLRPATYTAHTRIIAAAQTPRAQAEAAALASQVDAVATSRDLIAKALTTAGIDRDPDQVAANVAVTGLGSSALVDLAYTDRSARTAQLVTAALAAAVVTQLDAVAQGGLPDVIANLDSQLTDLATKQAPIAKQAQANPQDQVLQNRLAGINRTISDLAGDRSQLAEQLAAASHAIVVSAATVPPADSRGMPVKLAVAALLGLVLALLVVGVNETARPAVSGAARVARLLDVPILGTIRSDPTALGDVGRRVRLAGNRAGVSTIVLARSDRTPLPPELIDRITAATLRPTAPAVSVSIPVAGFEPVAEAPVAVGKSEAAAGGTVRASVAVIPAPTNHNGSVRLRRVCDLDELDPSVEQEHIGLVILTGGLTRISAIDDVRDLTTAAGWPLLGVLDASTRRSSR